MLSYVVVAVVVFDVRVNQLLVVVYKLPYPIFFKIVVYIPYRADIETSTLNVLNSKSINGLCASKRAN